MSKGRELSEAEKEMQAIMRGKTPESLISKPTPDQPQAANGEASVVTAAAEVQGVIEAATKPDTNQRTVNHVLQEAGVGNPSREAIAGVDTAIAEEATTVGDVADHLTTGDPVAGEAVVQYEAGADAAEVRRALLEDKKSPEAQPAESTGRAFTDFGFTRPSDQEVANYRNRSAEDQWSFGNGRHGYWRNRGNRFTVEIAPDGRVMHVLRNDVDVPLGGTDARAVLEDFVLAYTAEQLLPKKQEPTERRQPRRGSSLAGTLRSGREVVTELHVDAAGVTFSNDDMFAADGRPLTPAEKEEARQGITLELQARQNRKQWPYEARTAPSSWPNIGGWTYSGTANHRGEVHLEGALEDGSASIQVRCKLNPGAGKSALTLKKVMADGAIVVPKGAERAFYLGLVQAELANVPELREYAARGLQELADAQAAPTVIDLTKASWPTDTTRTPIDLSKASWPTDTSKSPIDLSKALWPTDTTSTPQARERAVVGRTAERRTQREEELKLSKIAKEGALRVVGSFFGVQLIRDAYQYVQQRRQVRGFSDQGGLKGEVSAVLDYVTKHRALQGLDTPNLTPDERHRQFRAELRQQMQHISDVIEQNVPMADRDTLRSEVARIMSKYRQRTGLQQDQSAMRKEIFETVMTFKGKHPPEGQTNLEAQLRVALDLDKVDPAVIAERNRAIADTIETYGTTKVNAMMVARETINTACVIGAAYMTGGLSATGRAARQGLSVGASNFLRGRAVGYTALAPLERKVRLEQDLVREKSEVERRTRAQRLTLAYDEAQRLMATGVTEDEAWRQAKAAAAVAVPDVAIDRKIEWLRDVVMGGVKETVQDIFMSGERAKAKGKLRRSADSVRGIFSVLRTAGVVLPAFSSRAAAQEQVDAVLDAVDQQGFGSGLTETWGNMAENVKHPLGLFRGESTSPSQGDAGGQVLTGEQMAQLETGVEGTVEVSPALATAEDAISPEHPMFKYLDALRGVGATDADIRNVFEYILSDGKLPPEAQAAAEHVTNALQHGAAPEQLAQLMSSELNGTLPPANNEVQALLAFASKNPEHAEDIVRYLCWKSCGDGRTMHTGDVGAVEPTGQQLVSDTPRSASQPVPESSYGGHTVAAEGIEETDRTTFTEQVVTKTASDYLHEHPELKSQRISRDGWYDNNTPRPKFEFNEKRLDLKVDADGNFYYDVSRMTTKGSFHGDRFANPEELLAKGELKILVSVSQDTQREPIALDIGPDGRAIVPKDVAALLYDQQNKQPIFRGRFAEVAEVTGTKDGVTHVRVLATQEGNGLNQIAETVQIETSMPESVEEKAGVLHQGVAGAETVGLGSGESPAVDFTDRLQLPYGWSARIEPYGDTGEDMLQILDSDDELRSSIAVGSESTNNDNLITVANESVASVAPQEIDVTSRLQLPEGWHAIIQDEFAHGNKDSQDKLYVMDGTGHERVRVSAGEAGTVQEMLALAQSRVESAQGQAASTEFDDSQMSRADTGAPRLEENGDLVWTYAGQEHRIPHIDGVTLSIDSVSNWQGRLSVSIASGSHLVSGEIFVDPLRGPMFVERALPGEAAVQPIQLGLAMEHAAAGTLYEVPLAQTTNTPGSSVTASPFRSLGKRSGVDWTPAEQSTTNKIVNAAAPTAEEAETGTAQQHSAEVSSIIETPTGQAHYELPSVETWDSPAGGDPYIRLNSGEVPELPENISLHVVKEADGYVVFPFIRATEEELKDIGGPQYLKLGENRFVSTKGENPDEAIHQMTEIIKGGVDRMVTQAQAEWAAKLAEYQLEQSRNQQAQEILGNILPLVEAQRQSGVSMAMFTDKDLPDGYLPKGWRIEVDMIKNTVHLKGIENNNVVDSTVAYTPEELPDAIQRLIQQNMAGK